MTERVWIYDQLNPDENRPVRLKDPKSLAEYIIKNAPPELTERQLEEREDVYLMSKGIK